MSFSDEDLAERERWRWTRENAHLYIRHDAHRFMRPDAPGWSHPDRELWNPYFRHREPQPDQARTACAMPERRAPERGGPAIADCSGPSFGDLLKLKSDAAALRAQLAVIKHEIATRKARGLPPLTEADAGWQIVVNSLACFQADCRKAGFDPEQPRDERGRWTDGGASDRPQIPKDKPASARLRNRVVKTMAKWLARAGARQLTGPIGAALAIAEASSWFYEAYPYVRAYLDEPKSLDELQQAVATQKRGYDVHHVVEQTSAEEDGHSRSMIDAPENLVRIPTLKHWEITGWYMTANEDYGWRSPRDYLRGKSWEERRRVGLRALIEHKVLKR